MTIFDANDHVQVDPNKDYFSELVGADKPYKTEKDLARAVVEKEAFINRLKTEKDGVLSELQGRANLEALIDKLAATSVKTPEVEPQALPQGQPVQSLTPDDIIKLLDERTSKANAEAAKAANQKAVHDRLRQTHGAHAAGFYSQKAQELGGEAFLDEIVSRSPQAAFKLLGIEEVQRQIEAPHSSVNSGGFVPSSGEIKNAKYFADLRRKMNPAEYWSPRIQNEIHEWVIKLGPKFNE